MTNQEIQAFIQEHNNQYIHYFEAIILPNGNVEYAIPSHLYKLEELWGVPKKEWYDGGINRDRLFESMPMHVSPVHWLCADLHCISCWYNCVVISTNPTKKSLNTLKQLIDGHCIARDCDIDITIEKEIEYARQSESRFNKLWQKKQRVLEEVVAFLCC